MLQPADIEAQTAQISALIEARLGPRGPDLARQRRKLGRRLPRALRADLDRLARAAAVARHPLLSKQVDPMAFAAASARLAAHLRAIDPRERRKTALLHGAGAMALNLLVLGVLVVAVLRWRGMV